MRAVEHRRRASRSSARRGGRHEQSAAEAIPDGRFRSSSATARIHHRVNQAVFDPWLGVNDQVSAQEAWRVEWYELPSAVQARDDGERKPVGSPAGAGDEIGDAGVREPGLVKVAPRPAKGDWDGRRRTQRLPTRRSTSTLTLDMCPFAFTASQPTARQYERSRRAPASTRSAQRNGVSKLEAETDRPAAAASGTASALAPSCTRAAARIKNTKRRRTTIST